MSAAIEPDTYEDAVPLVKASRLFPGRPSQQTLWRWMLTGCVGPDGSRVKLAFIKSGGRRFVMPADAKAFMDTLSRQGSGQRSPGEEREGKRAEEAGSALERLGC